MKLKLFIILLMIITGFNGYGQDPQLSQFYAAPLYLNPAFAGNTTQSRIIGNYRHQWPSIPKAFRSYAFSYDHNLNEINSGLGLMVMRDKAGTGGLRFTSLSGIYSYGVQLSRLYMFKAGVQLGYTWRNIDLNQLTFGDQLIRGGGATTSEPNIEPVSYPDASAGLLFYSRKYWIGAAFHHLNQPNQSLVGGLSRLPVKSSVHVGYTAPLKRDITRRNITKITVAAVYKAEKKWDQLDVGCYISHEPIIFGAWYRGIPVLKGYQPGYQNNDAAVIMVGWAMNDFKVGYSYDITISRLVSNTAGSHEISISYEWASPKNKRIRNKKRFFVPCSKVVF